MFREQHTSNNIEALIILTLVTVFIAASNKNETNGDLRILPEAGRIEEQPLIERENAGIYMYIYIISALY